MGWRRAKILVGCGGLLSLDGAEFWVTNEEAEIAYGPAVGNGRPERYLAHVTNLIGERDINKAVCMPAAVIELLDEYADDVPLVPWEDFLAAFRKSQNNQNDG